MTIVWILQQITVWTLRIYTVGAAVPLSTPTDLLAANVVCNQPAPPASPSINPTRVIFDDPQNIGRVCLWTDPGTGPLQSIPFGALTYEATLTATNVAGTSAESNRAPFTRPGLPPGIPTALKLQR
jgi:hypothetical protein